MIVSFPTSLFLARSLSSSSPIGIFPPLLWSHPAGIHFPTQKRSTCYFRLALVVAVLAYVHGYSPTNPKCWTCSSHLLPKFQHARSSSASTLNLCKSPYVSPVKQTEEQKLQDISASPPAKPRDQKPHLDNPVTGREKEETYARSSGDQKLKSLEKRSAHQSTVDDRKASRERVPHKDDSSERVGGHHSIEIQSRPDGLELRPKDQEIRRDFPTSTMEPSGWHSLSKVTGEILNRQTCRPQISL